MLALIDNYDSFTWNLVQYCGELGAETHVFRNDKITPSEILDMGPEAIILSPGPATPNEAGICLEMVNSAANTNTPLLGICLGHQTIGQVFGGNVIRGPKPVHGKTSKLEHNGKELFEGVSDNCQITRYHSLIVEEKTFPDTLEITAKTSDGVIMALKHKEKPIYGVQFHPESIATGEGHKMLENFLNIARNINGTAA